MRYVVVGSSHYTDSTLRTIRRADPYGIVFFVERSSEVAETIASRYKAIPVSGDLTEMSTYKKAEIDVTDVFIAITDSDALNIKLAKIAYDVYKIPKIIILMNNPLNLEALPKSASIKPITLQEHFVSQLELELSMDEWVEIPMPMSLGVKSLYYRFGKFSYKDLTPRKIKQELKGIEVAIIFFSSRGSIIENEEKTLGMGDYMVIMGEKSMVDGAKTKIESLMTKSLIATVGASSFSTPYKVG